MIDMEIAHIRYEYEDRLPDSITEAEYDELYPSSKVIDGVRMFPYVNVIVGSDSVVRIFLKDSQSLPTEQSK